MAKTMPKVPGTITASHIIGVTEASAQPTVYFYSQGQITRFTQRHTDPENIGYHPPKGKHAFFNNVPASMFQKAGPGGNPVPRSWPEVAQELRANNWKVPGGSGPVSLFEVVLKDNSKVGLHKSRGAFREVTDPQEKQALFAQIDGPNVYKAMDPQTHEFYFTSTLPQ